MSDRFRHRTLRTCIVLAGLTLLMALPAVSLGASPTPQEEALVRAAKKEGSVTLINPIIADSTERAFGAAFVKFYGLGSGFKFNNLRKGTGPTVAQVRQEIKAGKFTADAMFVNNPAFFAAATKQGAFLPLDNSRFKDVEEGLKAAGQYYQFPHVAVAFAYTFQPVWNTGCPGMKDVKITSIFDAVAPSLKGKTIASDLTKSSTYTNTVIALQEAGLNIDELWKKLKATAPIVEFRTEPKMQMVVKCERPIDMWNLAGRVPQFAGNPELRKNIKMGTYKEGHVMLGNQMAVLKGAAHPSAAKLLLNFFMTKEGSDVMAQYEGMYSFVKGWKIPKEAWFMVEIDKKLGMKDWVAAGKKFKSTRSDWSKYFK